MKKTNYKPEKEYKPTEELEAKEGYVRDYITNQHATIDNPDAILTDRIESLISQEHASMDRWTRESQYLEKNKIINFYHASFYTAASKIFQCEVHAAG